MIIKSFETEYWQSNSYLVQEGRRGILIDPCELLELKQILETEKIIPDYAILTHEHCDHITGTEWARKLGAKVIASAECARKIPDPVQNAARYFNEASKVQAAFEQNILMPGNLSVSADIEFTGQCFVRWCGHCIMLRETPGHSSGGICILVDHQIMFSGDTLLGNEPTNFRFPSGSKRKFEEVTIPWLDSLDGNITVYPGHWGSFTLQDRRRAGFNRQEGKN